MTQQSWTVTGPRTIGVAHVESLAATVIGGRIDVVAHDDPDRTDVLVEVHSVVGRPLEIGVDGTTLRIGHGSPESGWKGFVERFRGYAGKDSADVHVAVPARTRVKVATVQGEGLVAGVRSGLRVGTVTGSVVTSRTAGELRVDTVSGEVSAGEHDGDVRMDSVSGSLTATGDLRSLHVDSVSGTVTVDSRTTPAGVSVTAVSADVVVRLPDPDAMTYAIRCLSGRLLVDGTEERAAAGSFTRTAPDPGAPTLRVSAVSGDVAVLRGRPAQRPDGAPGPATAGAPTWGSPGTPPTSTVTGPEDR
ncbi:DUF4097 family beta strand repeat-containing protein [Cellulosimicrobium marinum]|uniref:DUF4097 family beta strand repeat-containing protein n=1 Tax=Cellulosimicrobium marinum TaxID=1638992 RepID=UPI001E348B45|nr:DUF4097 family beta strand repeat-containing protein [Cellulosimicrobium marinum]MCB7138086.1 DUF4097 domain-containing protein [Cellulosimicrobium marinum]